MELETMFAVGCAIFAAVVTVVKLVLFKRGIDAAKEVTAALHSSTRDRVSSQASRPQDAV